MKPSHITTPRTLAECTFIQGYSSVQPMAYRAAKWEEVAGYALAALIGFSLAAILFYGLSK